jgi:hypothetical protein
MAWYKGSRFWPNWNGLEWWKSVLACLEWLRMKEVRIGLTGIALNGGRCFWPDWKGYELPNMLLA